MTLSFVAARLQQMRGEESHESSFYLLKAISAVNKNLASPSKQTSDSTIATVACLANMEVGLLSLPHSFYLLSGHIRT